MPGRLLAGPPLSAGAESLADHRHRLGPRPDARQGSSLIPAIEASGLLGRGGAGFPVARKWATVAGRRGGRSIVLANGAEGEPLSAKDRTIMAARPHLVLDGAELAAEAVGADRIVLYVGGELTGALHAVQRAAAQRLAAGGRPVEIVAAPATYIAGEESAAIHYVNAGDARPTTIPPRPYERGVDGRPTLVQNVETLAHVALIARYGPDWYRELGAGATRGTALITVGGAAAYEGVTEIALGTPIGEVAAVSGAPTDAQAVLLGGYFGGWLPARAAWDLPLDPVRLRSSGTAFGCGVVYFLGRTVCGVETTARILDYMAGQSAAQCGPCVFGLRAISDAAARLASGTPADADDLARLVRWSGQLAGRGACKHPDGAVGLLQSALRVFRDDFERHQTSRTCTVAADPGRAA
jgi:NADH:ubiquinone oxidoreductase subunit F (NADH-binding)